MGIDSGRQPPAPSEDMIRIASQVVNGSIDVITTIAQLTSKNNKNPTPKPG